MISIIAAIDNNRAIGLNNRLLCRLPNDLKYFKSVTVGNTVIMGRRTFESLPVKPLPDRKNIVLSASLKGDLEGCIIAGSIEALLTLCCEEDECFVIGGAQVYRQMLPLAQKLYITRIYHSFEADAFFPEIHADRWQLQSTQMNARDEKHLYDYSFEIYSRIKSSPKA